MLKTNMLIFAVTLLIFNATKSKTCGLIELTEGTQLLNPLQQGNFIEDLEIVSNGSQISVFGWLKLTEILQAKYQIMQIQTYEKTNDLLVKQNMLDLFSLSYNATDQMNTFFEIEYNKSENMKSTAEYSINLNKNQWIFIAYSADFQKGQMQIYYNTYQNSQILSKQIVLQVDLSSFFIKQILQINIGCVNQNQINQMNISQCINGEVKDLNFMLQYFDDPSFLLYMNYHRNNVLQYIFDEKSNQQNSNLIFPIGQNQMPILINGIQQFENNMFVFRGETTLQIKNVIQLNEENEVQSPSIFMTFEYQEPLYDEFLLFELVDNLQPNFKIQVHLLKMKNKNERQLRVQIPQHDLIFYIEQKYQQNQIYDLEISFVQQFDQFWTIVNRNESERLPLKSKNNFDLNLFQKGESFQGQFKIVRLSLLESAAGLYYKQLYQDQKKECKFSCDIFSNLNYNSMQCLKCNEYKVLEPIQSQCVDYCVMGTKNIGDICTQCLDKDCSEIKQQKFFQITKVEIDQYEIKVLENFNKSPFLTNDFFDINIEGLQKQTDFKKTTEVMSKDPTQNTILLKLFFDDKYKNENFDIVFTLKKNLNLYSMQKNQLPIQVVVFDRLSTEQNPKIDSVESKLFQSQEQFGLEHLSRQMNPTLQQQQMQLQNNNNLDVFVNKVQKNTENTHQINLKGPFFMNQTLDVILDQQNDKYPRNSSNNQVTEQEEEHQLKHKDSYETLVVNDVINRDVSEFLFGIFVVAICFGLFGQLFRYKKEDFLFQKYVQMILVYQYIAFMALYDTALPETIRSFLGPLLSNFLIAQKIFDSPLKEKHSQNHNFNLDYQTFTHKKFQEHEISQHFIINCGLIFIIHVSIFAILIIVSILYKCKKRRNNNVEPNMFISALKTIKKVIANKLLVSMFLVFIIEITVFALYNFEHQGFHHPTFQFSLFLAFVYFLLTIFCLMHITCHPNQRRQNNIDEVVYYPEGYGYIYQGLTKKGCGRYFQAIQYLHYFLFSLVIIIAHHKPKVEIVFHFLILLAFSIYVMSKQPPLHEFWQFEQTFHQILLTLILLFYMIVVLDSDANRISYLVKDIMGDFVSYLMTVVLTWNAIVVIFCSIRNFYNKTCGRKKKRSTYDSVGSLPKSVEMKNEKPKQEKLKNTVILEESNEDDSQLIGNDEENNKERMNQTTF